MAEGWSNNVLCRYYLNGCCREGSECRFSHDRHSTQPSNVCRFYQQGQCSYGGRCRYDHVKTPAMATSAAIVIPKIGVPGNSQAVPSTPTTSTSTSTNTSAATRASPVAVVLPEASLRLPASPSVSPVDRKTPMSTSATILPLTSKMTVLKRQQTKSSDSGYGGDASSTSKTSSSSSSSSCSSSSSSSEQKPLLSVEAPEFVPTNSQPSSSTAPTAKSYAQALDPQSATDDESPAEGAKGPSEENPGDILCPYAIVNECRFGDQCLYIHGDLCELCGHACLHPTDQDQRRAHAAECMTAHERDMEHSFAVAQSRDKTCSICMDVIMDKWPSHERRFGILPNCVHVFCLSCIRTWRNTKQLENKTIRSCPQCRTPSDYVTPSKYWVESQEDKLKLIEDYKKALSEKHCKYFKQGQGECPFAGNCFYMHAYPDGRKATLPPPRPRRRVTADGDTETMQQFFLWDFMEERENRWQLHFEMEDMLDFFSDSDDSSDEFSDFDT